MIELFECFKSYNQEKSYVLKNINLRIGLGSMVAITGESGSGKTTLLNVLGGLDSFQGGKYLFNGVNVSKLSSNQAASFRNKNVGFVFQEFHLVSYLTAFDNIMIPVIHLNKTQRNEIKEKINNLAEKMNVSHILNHNADKLSGGEKQRVAVLRAIINNPKLIIADEPTGNLDERNSKILIEEFRRINEDLGITIVIATHDKNIENMCDVVYRIEKGNLVQVR